MESELGHGTKFSIYLPRAKSAAAASSQKATNKDIRGRETILVAEDERAIRLLTTRFLRELGYVVLEAGSGEEALSVAESHVGDIHVLLTDLTMPKMNGKELAIQICARRPTTRIVITSGLAERDENNPSDWTFVDKPYSPNQLATHLRSVLDGE